MILGHWVRVTLGESLLAAESFPLVEGNVWESLMAAQKFVLVERRMAG